VHAGGTVVRRDLQPGQTLLRGHAAASWRYTPSVNFEIQYVGKVETALFGGEGLFFARVSGPGTVWLQSLPFSRLASRVFAAAPQTRGLASEEGSVLGAAAGGGVLGGRSGRRRRLSAAFSSAPTQGRRRAAPGAGCGGGAGASARRSIARGGTGAGGFPARAALRGPPAAQPRRHLRAELLGRRRERGRPGRVHADAPHPDGQGAAPPVPARPTRRASSWPTRLGDSLTFLDPRHRRRCSARYRGIIDPYHLRFSPDMKWFVTAANRLDHVDLYRWQPQADKPFALVRRIEAPRTPSHLAIDSRSTSVLLRHAAGQRRAAGHRPGHAGGALEGAHRQDACGRLPDGRRPPPAGRRSPGESAVRGLRGGPCGAARAAGRSGSPPGQGAHAFRALGDGRHVFV
jgi:hypothetical protein